MLLYIHVVIVHTCSDVRCILLPKVIYFLITVCGVDFEAVLAEYEHYMGVFVIATG